MLLPLSRFLPCLYLKMPRFFLLLACLPSAVRAHQNSLLAGEALPGSHSSTASQRLQRNACFGVASSPLESLAVLFLAFSHPANGRFALKQPEGTRARWRPAAMHSSRGPGVRHALGDSSSRRAQQIHAVQNSILKGLPGSISAADMDVRQREMALVKWLEDNGVYLKSTPGWGVPAHPMRVESDTMEDFERSGRGLIARKAIDNGEAIIKIPTRCIMTKAKGAKILGKRIISDSLGEYLSLSMLLIHERSLGPASFWAPYIAILPTAEEVGQTWVWDEADLQLLNGSNVVATTVSLRNKLYSDYELLVATVLEPNRLDKSVFSWEAFKWAMSMLFSRAINLRETDELSLVPYADLLNHSPYINCFFKYEPIPFSDERLVILNSDRPYSANDQVLISYGQKSNAELVLLYGFVVDRNVFDEVEIEVGLMEDDPRYEEKASFLKMQGLPTKKTFPLVIDRFTEELIQFMRVIHVGQDVRRELDEFRYNELISIENEMSVFLALKKQCIEVLVSYPETLEEDQQLIDSARMFAALPRNARMAIKLRRNEKRILQRTIQVCDTRMEALRSGMQAPPQIR